jgi:flagellar biosynthetic protein FliR
MTNIPVKVRLALGALLALLVAPSVPEAPVLPETMSGTLGWMAMEVGVGLTLGFVCRIVFYILEFAGGVISMEAGLNMATILSPFSQGRSEIPGMILFYLGALLFLSFDLHHWLLIGFQRTYDVLPIGGAKAGLPLLEDMVRRTGQVFVLGLLMSAPVIAVSFLINLVFSILGRAVPQMNIFIESFSFRILAGLIVIGMTLNLMAEHIINYLNRLPDDLVLVARILGSG